MMDEDRLRRLAAKAHRLASATSDRRLAATLRDIARDFEAASTAEPAAMTRPEDRPGGAPAGGALEEV
jgi:hypothetical protein